MRERRRLSRTARGRVLGPVALAALVVVALAVLGFARWFGTGVPASPPAPDDPAEVAVAAPGPVAAPDPSSTPPSAVEPGAEPSPETGAPPQALRMEVDPRYASALENVDEETLARWEARVARERAARERFEQGLEGSQVRARDIDARLREALSRVDFVPELLDGGLMTGLRIRAIEPGSPLAEAGLRQGDLLVRIGEDRLDDPRELPRVLADAGPEPSLCVARDGGEICRDVVLR